MGLFSKKTKEKVVPETKADKPAVKKSAAKKTVKKSAVAKTTSTSTGASQLMIPKNSSIVRPHITEKAGFMAETLNTYVFEIHKSATKKSIADEIFALYKVTPTKVRVINKRAEEVLVRGKRGHHKAMKKAMVTLKKGDKIELA